MHFPLATFGSATKSAWAEPDTETTYEFDLYPAVTYAVFLCLYLTLRSCFRKRRVLRSILVAAVILSIAVLILTVRLWRSSSVAGRTLAVVALLVSIGSAVMVRQNYFEWMFHPIAAAGFISAGDAHLADKEMIMTVQIGTDARAYPIAQMAYHHILNDTVGTEPIVVTY